MHVLFTAADGGGGDCDGTLWLARRVVSRMYGKIMLTISIKFKALRSREKTIPPASRGRYLSTNSNRGQNKGRAKGGSEITVERIRAADGAAALEGRRRGREREGGGEKRATVFLTYLPKVYLELRRGYDVVEENSLRKSGIKCLSCARPPPPLPPCRSLPAAR